MISIVIIVAGALLVFVGVIFLVPAFFSKWQLSQRIASGETDLKDNKRRRDERIKLITRSGALTVIGVIIAVAGIFLGFADRGDGLHFKNEAVPAWSANVTADGKYQTDNGREYTYYIFVEGNKYYFCGEVCESIDALEERISKLGVGNTVLLVDNYASAAAYKSVSTMLNEMGINYEMEER